MSPTTDPQAEAAVHELATSGHWVLAGLVMALALCMALAVFQGRRDQRGPR